MMKTFIKAREQCAAQEHFSMVLKRRAAFLFEFLDGMQKLSKEIKD